MYSWAKKLKVGTGIEAGFGVENQLVGLGQHATCTASWIVDLDDLAIPVHQIVMGEQDADHQLDDFAWREVISGLFIGLFVEATDQVFEQIAHLNGSRCGLDGNRRPLLP